MPAHQPPHTSVCLVTNHYQVCSLCKDNRRCGDEFHSRRTWGWNWYFFLSSLLGLSRREATWGKSKQSQSLFKLVMVFLEAPCALCATCRTCHRGATCRTCNRNAFVFVEYSESSWQSRCLLRQFGQSRLQIVVAGVPFRYYPSSKFGKLTMCAF